MNRSDPNDNVRCLGWTEQELKSRRKNDPAKLAVAARLRKETTLTIKQIASRVSLGSSKSANAKLHQWMKGSRDKGATATSASKKTGRKKK